MRGRSARPLAFVMAVLLSYVEPASCLAEQPPSTSPPTAVPPGSSRVQAPALPPTNPAGRGQPAPAPGQPQAARSLEPGHPLRPAPTEETDVRLPITLATALRLADARPIIVAAAQAGVWVAEAQLTRARLLWVPTLNIGFDYTRHDGGVPDFNKGGDAIFQPLAARQTLNTRHRQIQTARNDVLMATAMAYFMVHQTRGQYASALYCAERGHDLVERIAHLSRDLVPCI
jgi:hypothetical protein